MPMQGYGPMGQSHSAPQSKHKGGYGGGAPQTDPTKYKTVKCRHFEQSGSCSLGDKCSFAHGDQELRAPQSTTMYKPKGSTTPNDAYVSSGDSNGHQGGFRGRGGFRGGRGGGRGGFNNNFNNGGHFQQQQSANHKTQLCKNFEQGECKYGAKCSFAHGEGELKKSNSAPSNVNPRFNQPPPPVPGLSFAGFNGMPPMPQPQLNIF